MTYQFADGRQSYSLDENRMAGFTQAVRNGQTRLALDYAVLVFREMTEEISELRNELVALKTGTKVEDTLAVKVTRSPRQKESNVGDN